MILIAESGSSKCEWWLIIGGEVIKTYETQGFNPYYHSIEEIENGIQQNSEFFAIRNDVQQIRYLGAGCSTQDKCEIVSKGLEKVFSNASIKVEHDLLGAAYATYNGEPGIVGILGTGSNSCFFDGKKLMQKTPSLGFIMGDEGGGGYFGKKLVTAFAYGWLDDEISKDFSDTYQYSVDQLIHRVNSEPHANVFLAGFMPFLAKHQSNPFIENLLVSGMEEYLVNHVLPFKKSSQVPIHFVGSVAHYFKKHISIAADIHGFQIGNIIQKPGKNLVDYFLKFGI